MEVQQTMADLLDLYRTQRYSWEEFVERVWPLLVRQIQISSNGNRRDAIDAAGEFYPVLRRVTSSYRDTGSSFDAYLRTSIRYFCRKRRYEAGRRGGWEISTEPESPVFDGLFASESVPETIVPRPCPFPDSPAQTLRSRDATRRQILFILFLNLPVLDNGDLERYSRLLAVPLSWMVSLQSVVLARMEPRRDRRKRLMELRDRHFAMVIEYQRLLATARTNAHRRRYEQRMRFHRDRWRGYETRLRRFRCTLSHRELAILLGVPKGSIDSAMNQFRQKVEDTQLAV